MRDGPTDGRTGGRTNGQTHLQRCEDASNKFSLMSIQGKLHRPRLGRNYFIVYTVYTVYRKPNKEKAVLYFLMKLKLRRIVVIRNMIKDIK